MIDFDALDGLGSERERCCAGGGGAKGLVLDWLSGEVTAGSARALKDLVEAATALME